MKLKPENSTFTDSQWQAIYDAGDNILVSASAGSGKTTVLVERVIEKIIDGTNVDQLLIVTFTEAAAREMKERIQKALQENAANTRDPETRQRFLQQLTLLPTANISTLHAFCLTVIRRFYYLIDMDPVFRLLTDETETLLLKEDVWDDLREEWYSKQDETFFQLTANFSNDRSDAGLTDVLFSLYDFARANPDPEGWLKGLTQAYDTSKGLGASPLFKEYLQPSYLENLVSVQTRYQEMIRLCEGVPELKKITELAYNEAAQTTQLQQFLEAGDLETTYHAFSNLTFDKFPTIRKPEEAIKEVKDQAKQLRDDNVKALRAIQKDLFAVDPETMTKIMAEAQTVVGNLSEVCLQFMHRYRQRKSAQGLLDFNDLEHLTLQILATLDSEGWHASEASAFYREKFTEVLVDEYQDINRLQEALLHWVTRTEPGNMFMVGDVKQSIYAFRLADPTLFIEKYQHYERAEGGRRIVLAENFRSRKEVLDFTNLIFDQLMDEQVGQIAYDEAAKLVNGFTAFPETATFDTEIWIYEKGVEAETELVIEDKTEGELRMTARRIRQLMDEGFEVYDKKQKVNRPLRYSDIVLLTPTKKNNLAILELFKEADIPVEVNDAQNYFQATEIRIMVALLQLIDNPYQDIPLAAVLRSPLVGLNEQELAEIRLANKQSSFYEALKQFLAATESPLQAKLEFFMEQFQTWRELARRDSLATLIWQIYQDTAFLDYVGGMPAGAQRQANLRALAERAASYEKTSFRGLFQFVRFIEKMQEKDKDLAEPVLLGGEEAVRVMTIHASKGLEFPVVFVLDLTKQFRLSELNGNYIFDEELGAGIRYLEPTTRTLYPTMPYLAIRQAKLQKLLSEEMRKLYVALTRAEQKLILVGSYQDEATAWKTWAKVAQHDQRVLPASLRLAQGGNLMNWIGYSLIRHPHTAIFQKEWATANIPELKAYPDSFSIHFVQADVFAEGVQTHQETVKTSPATGLEILAAAKGRLAFQYPYSNATETTSYQSVSEIKRVFEDPDESELLKIDVTTRRPINRFVQEELPKPKFLQETRAPLANEIGTATHYVLQVMPLAKPTMKSLKELVVSLVQEKRLAPQVAEKINLQKIITFYDSDLGQRILKEAEQVKREQPFSMLLPANRLFADYPTADEILVHGIVDGYIDNDELVLYDFKTDHLSGPAGREKALERYRGQLNVYKEALELATGKKVAETWLILLEPEEQIKL